MRQGSGICKPRPACAASGSSRVGEVAVLVVAVLVCLQHGAGVAPGHAHMHISATHLCPKGLAAMSGGVYYYFLAVTVT